MRKNQQKRDLLATSIAEWEALCGFPGPREAAAKLGLPLRTYHRFKADGLPNKLQREVILDRMEAALPKRRG